MVIHDHTKVIPGLISGKITRRQHHAKPIDRQQPWLIVGKNLDHGDRASVNQFHLHDRPRSFLNAFHPFNPTMQLKGARHIDCQLVIQQGHTCKASLLNDLIFNITTNPGRLWRHFQAIGLQPVLGISRNETTPMIPGCYQAHHDYQAGHQDRQQSSQLTRRPPAARKQLGKTSASIICCSIHCHPP